jgi:hypothetical protein
MSDSRSSYGVGKLVATGTKCIHMLRKIVRPNYELVI